MDSFAKLEDKLVENLMSRAGNPEAVGGNSGNNQDLVNS